MPGLPRYVIFWEWWEGGEAAEISCFLGYGILTHPVFISLVIYACLQYVRYHANYIWISWLWKSYTTPSLPARIPGLLSWHSASTSCGVLHTHNT
ncbi:uncharacterized protein K444DRAFT_16051 [Hyaloscypha bicolor E]|uniref:Uncharacterized protein n=1 Tax=Hyaloscypha bicolor E TaxID=1095630 RepID=A0A2J6TWW8_9HELO|nr:uncharacterized protein K444DRAFT_16051 [Hyaloscypha bicolor E]PMD67448.1 hypothetical protein K444DRAFT_16051 [Hyaloscypha bicolor E]